MKTTRRTFIKRSGATLASAALLSQIPLKLFAGYGANNFSFGFQVWTIREKLIADFAGTLKEMSELGYSEVEMCSPLGYSLAGFGPLNKMSGAEMKKIVEDNGMKCTSSHFTSGELNESLDNRIEWAAELGMEQMILSSFWLPEDASLDDYRKSAEDLNIKAEKTRAAGIKWVFITTTWNSKSVAMSLFTIFC